MKHTPGPWKTIGFEIKSVNPLCKDLCFIKSLVKGIDKECALANARLIAAAPDLLEALKSIAYCKGTNGYLTGADASCFVKIAERAINKAERR